jgi:hypothetical protein
MEHESVGNFFVATVAFRSVAPPLDWDSDQIDRVLDDLGSMMSAELAADRFLYETQNAVIRCSSERFDASKAPRRRVSVHMPNVVAWASVKPAIIRAFEHASVYCEPDSSVWEQRPFTIDVSTAR